MLLRNLDRVEARRTENWSHRPRPSWKPKG